MGGLDERLAVPHMVGVTVGEQDGAQGQVIGPQEGHGAPHGAGSGVDDEGGLARACGQDIAVGGEHGCDGALQDHAPSLLGSPGSSVNSVKALPRSTGPGWLTEGEAAAPTSAQ